MRAARILLITSLVVLTVRSDAFALEHLAHATLRLTPSVSLPGLPVGFVVTVANLTDRTLRIEDSAALHVTTKDGGQFDAEDVTGSGVFGLPKSPRVVHDPGYLYIPIPPRSNVEFYYRLGEDLTGNEFFTDSRLTAPGVYLLQLQLEAAVAPTELPAGTDPIVDTVVTDQEKLTIGTPEREDDIAIWAWLQAHKSPSGQTLGAWAYGRDLAALVAATYPNSSYYPYLVGMAPAQDRTAELALYDRAIAMNPPEAVRYELLLQRGAAQMSWHVVDMDNGRNAESALAWGNAAVDTLKKLVSIATINDVRLEAERIMAEYRDRKQIDEEIAWLGANDCPAPKTVEPFVDCVSMSNDDELTAWFGFNNPNDGGKMLLLGSRNQITPAPRDAGQPRWFKPGTYSRIVASETRGDTIIWHLDGSRAVASRGSRRCD
jgi:hypothetical protein